MTRATIYCVQPFWGVRTSAAKGTLRRYASREQALRAGEAAARQVGGAIVYSVEGDPVFETWGQPCELARHGEVPDVRL